MVALPAPAKVTVGGLPVVRLGRAELAALMVQDCQQRDHAAPPKLVFSANGESIALANTNPAMANLLAQADYIHADGQSVVWASRWLTATPLPERVATTDFFHDAARAAQDTGLSFYFLGGPEDHNARMVAEVQRLYPRLRISGRHHDRYPPEAETALVADIVATRTDVLWLSLGRPRQEEFCIKYRKQLRGVGWLKTCGGLFKYVIGEDSRAPEWMQQAGLEWLYRAAREPRRLGRRYLSTNPQALWYLLTRTK